MSDCHKTGAQINLPEVFFRFTMSSFSQMAFTADLEVLPATAEGMKTRNEFADAVSLSSLAFVPHSPVKLTHDPSILF